MLSRVLLAIHLNRVGIDKLGGTDDLVDVRVGQKGVVPIIDALNVALAAMLGAVFILDDPIFSGLAITLIFGILVSTLLTLLVIPVLYYVYMYRFENK